MTWRNLWRHKRRTWITLGSIALGLAFVIFFITLAEGIYAQLIDDAVRMQAGHVTVEDSRYRDAPAVDLVVPHADRLRDRLQTLDGVAATKLLVSGQGIARSGHGAVGVSILGVEASVEARTSPLAGKVVEGRWLEDSDKGLVVLGQALAERLRLATGRKLVVASNDRNGNLVEQLFRVAGTFRTGAEEIDGYLILTGIDDARRLFALGGQDATWLGILAEPHADPLRLADAVNRDLAGDASAAGLLALPWQQMLPELWAFIRLDRVSDRVFQGLLIVLVLSTILNTLLMSVLEREHELAVLVALGTTRARLGVMVALEAVWMAALGCLAGVTVGGAVSGWVQVYGWDLSTLYGDGMTISGLAISPVVHCRVTPSILAAIAAAVFTATVALALVPVRRAIRVSPAQCLR